SSITIPCLLRAIDVSSSRNVVLTNNILRRTTRWLALAPHLTRFYRTLRTQSTFEKLLGATPSYSQLFSVLTANCSQLFSVFASKNRTLPNQHSGGIRNHLSEHLTGPAHRQNQHLH